MQRTLLREGPSFSIYALVPNGGCLAEDFIAAMGEASRKSMLTIIQRIAEVGIVLNTEKSRKVSDEIFELKSRQGDRLLYFFPPSERGVIIITHGFKKRSGPPLSVEVERAERLRADYIGA